MMFAELLPKTNTPGVEQGELVFCSSEEGVKEVMKIRPAGKLLIVTDRSALAALTRLPPRALCLVLDGEDCLPLFLSSDDVSTVVAAGRAGTLIAARFFAELRKIPCVVFPASAALDGAYEPRAEVLVDGMPDTVSLKQAHVCCDRALLSPSLGQAYMRLLLARLALIEAKALRGFGLKIGQEEAEERAYRALLSLKSETLSWKDVVRKNAVIRRCEQDGMSAGEGVFLANETGSGEQAFFLLSALYSTFFLKGKPRLWIPDYAARAKAAGTVYARQRVPTLEEYARRTAALEKMRTNLYWETANFSEGETHFRKNFYVLAGHAMAQVKDISPLAKLPEQTMGLCSLIRDFGLMEWSEVNIFQKSV